MYPAGFQQSNINILEKRLMKVPVCLLLIFIMAVWAAGDAHGGCNCRQPAYKDQIDFLARYTACLEECLNAQIQDIRLKMENANRRISDLDAEIDRLNLKLRNLENRKPADGLKK
jgi:hypothetical protein